MGSKTSIDYDDNKYIIQPLAICQFKTEFDSDISLPY